MQLSLKTDRFKASLSNVIRAKAQKPVLPVLNCVLFSKEGSSLTLTATNLEIFVSDCMQVEDDGEDFKVAVSADKIASFVSKLKSDDLTISFTDEKAIFKSKGVKVEAPTMSANDFPNQPNRFNDDAIYFEDINVFLDGLRSVPFYATDATRGILNAVNIKKVDKNIVFAATDGYRLGKFTAEVQHDKQFKEINIPGFAVKQVLGSFSDKESNDLNVYQSDNYILLESGTTSVCTRLLGGGFPSYEKILRPKSDGNISFKVKELIEAIELGSAFADSQTNKMSLTLKPAFLLVGFTSGNGEYTNEDVGFDRMGEFNESYYGKRFEFNTTYLIQILKKCATHGDTAIMSFIQTDYTPVIFSVLENPNFQAMLMPMR